MRHSNSIQKSFSLSKTTYFCTEHACTKIDIYVPNWTVPIFCMCRKWLYQYWHSMYRNWMCRKNMYRKCMYRYCPVPKVTYPRRTYDMSTPIHSTRAKDTGRGTVGTSARIYSPCAADTGKHGELDLCRYLHIGIGLTADHRCPELLASLENSSAELWKICPPVWLT